MAPELTPGDRELLDQLARRVVELRMTTPAILALETARPVSVIAGQAMLFFEPLVQALFPLPRWRRFAALAERRDAIEALTERIEIHAAEAADHRRPAAAPADSRPEDP